MKSYRVWAGNKASPWDVQGESIYDAMDAGIARVSRRHPKSSRVVPITVQDLDRCGEPRGEILRTEITIGPPRRNKTE